MSSTKPAIPPTQATQSQKMSLSTIALIFGLLTAGGGITGYVRTGSIPSVAAGCTVGALYLFGGYRLQNRQAYGIESALLASIVLAGSSIPRAIKGGFKPLPTGLSVIATVGMLAFGNGYANKSKTL
ncbi:TMEM14 protein [Cercospora beticola]|uniref:TMEM14 protein n=1 Tax=Cercospora beticola TaxID=122368 RepID=A0A2G5HL65_CERBT|nr:TMEM14 protein [Cercospora beticola]PIA93311.1 TMEM14 protein [Cercospora beticola]WPB01202.1 hypothetical protein RHO25_005825 [Cercospora beticola]CAK1364041.1 unnamed protein product [Cercospora beticola]